MNDNTKTLIFVGIALVVGVIAFATGPQPPGISPDEELGTKLYKEFNDPLAVHSLEIVKYDEEAFSISKFRLSQVDGVWSITSHDNYPADAKDQVADAASSVMDLEILGIATDKAREHELYGVVEPDKETIKVGATGIGTLVTMRDAGGKELARMIIGKKVSDKEELRYVRKAGQDRVYTVKADTDKLSTKFEDWIEEDLLKLDSFNITRVTLNDYAIVNVRDRSGRPGGKAVQERSAMTFAYKDFKWILEDLKQPDKEQNLVSVKPADDEEPNSSTLNDLKNALDDLKIVDVERKQKKLADEIKGSGELRPTDQEGMLSLVERGFFAQEQDGKWEVYSDAGEVQVGMKDGVEYVLHFGKIAGGGTSGSDEDSDKKEAEDESESEELGLNRYILVSIRLNAELIPKPELKSLPPVEAKKPELKPLPPVDAKKGKVQPDEKQDSKQGETEKKEDEHKSEQDAERKRIEDENKRAQEDYEKKLKEAQEKVRKLNYRFADWYFVISEDVYKKIHLSKDDVLKKEEEKKDDTSNTGSPFPNINLPSN